MTRYTQKDRRKLSDATIAIALIKLMLKALREKDEELAQQVEVIALHVPLDKAIELPFDPDDLSEVLVSQYIVETKEIAEGFRDDYYWYNVHLAPEPTAEGLKAAQAKLEHLSDKLEAKFEQVHAEKVAAIMKRDNTKWRQHHGKDDAKKDK